MASELKVDKFTGVTTAGSIDVTGEGNSTTTNLQQGLVKFWISHDAKTDSTLIVLILIVLQIMEQENYTFSFTNNMSNNDYALATHGLEDSGGGGRCV